MTPENILLYSFSLLFILTLVFKSILLILNIKSINENYDLVPHSFSHKISIQDHHKAQNYSRTRNLFSLYSNVFHALVLLLWLKFGLHEIDSIVQRFELSSIMAGVFYILLFSLCNYIISIPEGLYSTFVIEQKFEFNKVTPKIYIIDNIKQLTLGFVIGFPFLYIFLHILYALGELWWLYAWTFIMVFQFIMIWAYPAFISPLFNKFSPLEDDELKQMIEDLGKRSQISFKDYYVMDASLRSAHGNAYFTGLGKFKRIVFFDTLLKSLSSKEVIAVLAHELGHMKKKHILKSIMIGTLSLFITLFIMGELYSSPFFYNAFGFTKNEPYIALVIFLLISPFYTYFFTPLSSWLSRKHEFEADEFAAKVSDPKDLISALLQMYKDNSSTLTPHRLYSKFYFSHPPAKERIEFLNKFIKD